MTRTERIGTKIRRARERLHLSQEDLAAKVEASVRAVGNWENDRNIPRNKIGALEEVLGISLTGERGAPPAPEYADPVLQDLWEKLQTIDLPETTQRTLVEYCHFLRTREGGRPESLMTADSV